VLQLWGEKGGFEHHGYFDGINLGLPQARPGPPPGADQRRQLEVGIDFSARNVDINFASLDTLENMKDYTTTIKDKARTEVRAPLSTMTYGLVVVRDAEKEAKEVFQQVVDMGDYGAAENVINIALSGSAGSFEHAREFQERFVAGWGGYPLVGTPEQVVEGLGQLNEAGMDGMIMGLLDYNEEMKYFGEKVMPLMVQAGLRQ
jgi:alkanesulfonate monooxygenase SsuD/methylene tetrahydromethanopterin reductase-like flavin-dependent oxidoreductase (luciferase family)